MSYKNQHFVTKAYIKAWCDPETPNNGAFVWAISKDTHKISRKSPKSLFSEVDFYTVYDSEGNRILELEHKLKEIEDKFIQLRDNKLQKHQSLEPEDRLTVALFVSTMFARVKFQREIQEEIWQELLDKLNGIPKDSMEYKQIVILQKQPMPFHLFNFVNISAPILLRMNCAIYETRNKPGFIASDNPCIWPDPALLYPEELVTWFGLGSSKLNVILPVSPNQCISLQRRGPDGYYSADDLFIDATQNLIASNSKEYIVLNQKLVKESWFSIE